jgi:hypothetical protein
LSAFEIPALQIDPHTLPPPILTSEPDSFAQRTFKVRIPRIIEETVELNFFPSQVCIALEKLRTEILDGSIRGLSEATADQTFWDRISRPYLGQSWLDVPWYWAEAFFYRRILEATHYFKPPEATPLRSFDPYSNIKQTEWEPHAAPRSVNSLLEGLPTEPQARFQRLLHASLWGNRTDLSYNVAEQVERAARIEDERSNLLVDDSEHVWEYLCAQPRRHLVIITDNVGTELLADLALADFMLARGLITRIDLHLKPQPFFVSDAMANDVVVGLNALAAGGDAARSLGERLQVHLQNKRLRVRTHWFYATSLFYFQLPADLHRDLGRNDLVILKGDVNYRRLLGDAHWPPTTPFRQPTAYFPAPLVALRTLKAELIVGLALGQAQQLYGQDPSWQVNGQRGLVQGRL